MVQWFSGFQECSSAVRGLRSTIRKLFLVLLETGGGVNRDRKVGIGRFGLGMGIKGGKVSRD